MKRTRADHSPALQSMTSRRRWPCLPRSVRDALGWKTSHARCIPDLVTQTLQWAGPGPACVKLAFLPSTVFPRHGVPPLLAALGAEAGVAGVGHIISLRPPWDVRMTPYLEMSLPAGVDGSMG